MNNGHGSFKTHEFLWAKNKCTRNSPSRKHCPHNSRAKNSERRSAAWFLPKVLRLFRLQGAPGLDSETWV